MYKIYEVKNGDTLMSIAQALRINPEALAAINGINLDTNLIPTSYIVVPSEGNMFERYVIQRGDTIYSVAGVYGINPAQLLKLNGLNETDIIYPGQEILVPTEGINFYVTGNNDSLVTVAQMLGASPDKLIDQNKTIYLMPDQLLVYKK